MRNVLVALMLVVVACGAPGSAQPSESTDSAEMMAAALTQLVTVDHTFGDGPPPFTEYLIETKTVPISLPLSPEEPDSVDEASETQRPLTDDERDAIETAISEFGPVTWIDDPKEWRTEDLMPEIEGSAILGVDEPIVDGDEALVPVSLWCGGLCGTWFAYQLQRIDGTWSVVGIEGPIAIS